MIEISEFRACNFKANNGLLPIIDDISQQYSSLAKKTRFNAQKSARIFHLGKQIIYYNSHR